MDSRYKISSKEVTFECFEGEILIINLDNGNYHSLRGSAVQAWPLILAGKSATEIAALWPDQADADTQMNILMGKLAAAGLTIARGELPVDPVDDPADVAAFTAPLLDSYTDMQDLLMLDPIHEVDLTGWPKQPEAPTEVQS